MIAVINEGIIAERIREAREMLYRSKGEKDDYKEYIQKVFDLGVFSKEDEFRLNKVKHERFTRDARVESHNVKWLYGEAPSQISVESDLELKLNELTTVIDTIELQENIKHILNENGKKMVAFTKDDRYKSLYGSTLIYKIESTEYRYKHSKFGYIMIDKEDEKLKAVVVLNKRRVEDCGACYDKMLKDICSSIKKSVGSLNNIDIEFRRGV